MGIKLKRRTNPAPGFSVTIDPLLSINRISVELVWILFGSYLHLPVAWE